MSRSQRAYVHNNYLYRFPVDYSDISVTRSTNEDDKFNGSYSSGSLLLRQDTIYDSEFDFLQRRLQKNLKRSKKKKRPKQLKHFNNLCLCLLAFFAFLGVLFYWSMWLISRCETNLDESLPRTISQLLMDSFDKERIKENLRWLSTRVHVAGTEEQLSLMHRIEKEYREMGYNVKTYEYNVLLSYPDYSNPNTIYIWANNQWTLISNGKGKAVEGEDQKDEKRYVWWNAYSTNGTVFAPIVYANYGSEEDFDFLKMANIQIEGRIVLMRYGSVFRGDKVMLAQNNGAVGVILYSDPFEFSPESQSENQTFPHTFWLPSTEAQRGTLLQTNGDPETQHLFPSKDYVHRSANIDELYESQMLPSIPVTPISYSDAQKIFDKLDGIEVLWPHWKGGLLTTYRLDGSVNFRMEVRNRLERRIIKNIVSTLAGEEEKYVMLSNHVDAWTFGAIDPNSGTSIMIEAARVLMKVSQEKEWRPKRSIAFCHFDGEEYGLIGSTEFTEEMLNFLRHRAVALINVDNVNGNTTIVAKAVPLLYKTLTRAASKINQPNANERENGRLTLLDSWRFHGDKGPLVGDKSIPAMKLPLFGSDFQPFISYVGIPVADIRIESSPTYSYAIYHSAHESAWAVDKFIDPTGDIFVAMGQFWLEVVREIADNPILPFDVLDYAVMMSEFVRKLDLQLRRLEIDNALDLKWYKNQLAHLETAIANFHKLAKRLHQHIHALKHNKYEGEIKTRLINAVNERLLLLERSFIIDQGLWPNAPMKRHIVFSSSKTRDIFPNSAFALILDPALRWKSDKKPKFLEEIRLGFTKIQYCI